MKRVHVFMLVIIVLLFAIGGNAEAADLKICESVETKLICNGGPATLEEFIERVVQQEKSLGNKIRVYRSENGDIVFHQNDTIYVGYFDKEKNVLIISKKEA
jgi:hypothetical protein